jgi:hypothetical protein
MPQSSADDAEFLAILEEESRVGVPQVVESLPGKAGGSSRKFGLNARAQVWKFAQIRTKRARASYLTHMTFARRPANRISAMAIDHVRLGIAPHNAGDPTSLSAVAAHLLRRRGAWPTVGDAPP